MTALALLTWLSPSFPVGAFAYAGGLEAAVARDVVRGGNDLADWLAASIAGGAIRADTIALALAARGEGIDDLDDLVLALAGSPAREGELRALGAAFVEAAAPWWPDGLDTPASHPVALGALCRAHGIGAGEAAAAFALAAATNAVQAAQRLLPVGQREGVRVVAELHEAIAALADDAVTATLDDLFTSTPIADICALSHPTIEPRLFRS